MSKRPRVFGAWTADDIRALCILAGRGKSPKVIAQRLSRHVTAVERQSKLLGIELPARNADVTERTMPSSRLVDARD